MARLPHLGRFQHFAETTMTIRHSEPGGPSNVTEVWSVIVQFLIGSAASDSSYPMGLAMDLRMRLPHGAIAPG